VRCVDSVRVTGSTRHQRQRLHRGQVSNLRGRPIAPMRMPG
jgi:hypothetical protein